MCDLWSRLFTTEARRSPQVGEWTEPQATLAAVAVDSGEQILE
jgi:hypothetical protein